MPPALAPRLCRAFGGVVAAAGLLLAASPAAAQPALDVLVGSGFDWIDRGAFAPTSADADAAPAGSVALDHLALDGRLRLTYTLDAGTFTTEGDWRFLQQTAGGRYRFALGDRTGLYLGGQATVRTNGTSWSAAAYRGLGTFSNLEWKGATAAVRAGARADRRVFPDQPQLDQWEVGSFASAQRSFQTRTTVIAEVALGWKQFDAGPLAWAVPLADPGSHTPSTTGGTSPTSGGGNGAGAPAGTGASRGRGTSQSSGVVLSTMSATSAGPSAARMVTVFGRVAQSVAHRVAVSFEATRRDAFGAVAPAVVDTPELFIDDGVYDDPFASDATVWRVGVKAAAASGRTLETGVSHWAKLYESTPALGLDGLPRPGVMRDDRVWRTELSWREPLAPGRTGDVDLALVISHTFMDSTSTDAFYRYRSHRVRAMLAIAY